MNILGVSGLEGAMPFKRAHWPGLEEREYRISQGHDSAAALLVDGSIVAAAEEERFNREKHSPRFPCQAIRYCLDHAGLNLEDIHVLAHAFDYGPYRSLYSLDPVTAQFYRDVCSREAMLELVRRDLPNLPPERFQQVNHHRAHAASAFYTSGWEDCLVVVMDAMGEAHGSSIYRGRGGELGLLSEISALDSIGILYSLVTLHLGFDFNSDEYKIMGLAPYGDPARFRRFFEDAVELRSGGPIRIPVLRLNRTREERENYAATRAYLTERLIPPRAPDSEITDAHRDVAAALQECLDRVMLHICSSFGESIGATRVALAGGVALNCTANGRLLESGRFRDVYVQPAAGDDGAALGAALVHVARHGQIRNVRMPVPFLGPSYSSSEIERAVAAFAPGLDVRRCETFEETCEQAARLIAEGRVIAWHRGRMEFGPRALGNRSILADPSRPEMRDRINAMVKMREAFRPFAPAVTIEEAPKWFETAPGTEFPYMITTVNVRERFRAELPAVTHVNGSARLQTVSRSGNPEFHRLLQTVGRITGREIVLNTSFNVKGQPIVNTPTEAIETFLRTGIEYLFLGNVLIARRAAAPLNESRKSGERVAAR
jgi:carbamoyltransferase